MDWLQRRNQVHIENPLIQDRGRTVARVVYLQYGKIARRVAQPTIVVPVQVPDKHRPHPGPVLVGVLERPRDVVGLLHLGDVHPAEIVLVLIEPVTPVRGGPVFAGVAQPTELCSPDRLVAQAVQLHQVPHHLDAAEGEAIAIVARGQLVEPPLWLIGKTVGMVAEGVEVVAGAEEEHLAGILPLVHRAAVVPAPAVARALDAAHRRQSRADDERARVHLLDPLVG